MTRNVSRARPGARRLAAIRLQPRALMVLAATLLACSALWADSVVTGDAPAYSAKSIVDISYTQGVFAPNSVAVIFGTNLSFNTHALSQDDIQDNRLPIHMGNVQVLVSNMPAPLYYVSPGQINLLIPGNLLPGTVKMQVVRQGVYGPAIDVTIVNAAPQLFFTNEYAIAEHADASLVTPDHPAHPNEIVVLFASGLGLTNPNPEVGEIPQYPGIIRTLSDLRVYVGGAAVDSEYIKYAGLSPGSCGLYQINVALPPGTGTDPEIRVAVGEHSSASGLKLAVGEP
ncbi:MAG TPA: hypothetical protein VG675_12755 [Bryobacteraceae bacterium]|nr:hypothetical protein [Bryobacteraceae bacterium]